MKSYFCIILVLIPGLMPAQKENLSGTEQVEVFEMDNAFFRNDKFWRGADGAASVDLENGNILWLFSDTFIDPDGTGKRSNSTMINNSIAIQKGHDLEKSEFTFYYKGKKRKPEAFFELPGDTWFWTGHGIMVKDKLIVFLLEETATKKGIGFEATGWYIAIINNPDDDPDRWNIKYVKGPETFGVVVGSAAVLKDSSYVYAFGVKEPATHQVYLLRFDINSIVSGNPEEFAWWTNNSWTKQVSKEPEDGILFIGQTEFSVHYDKDLKKYIQIQTYGFGRASIGYRLAGKLRGPWSDPVIFYTPRLNGQKEFVYTANAHPELKSDGLVISFNVNNADFSKLVSDEEIYFPEFINVKIKTTK